MKTYKIADLTVHMDTIFRTLEQAEPYRVEDSPTADVVISTNPLAIMKKHPHLNLDDSEYISSATSFYRQLIGFNGMMLHASCVVVDGMAYLFSASSGTGKSTHTQLWLELFGDRAYILNDDKPALRVLDGEVYVYGTPWSGKYDCSRNERAKLGGIAVVKRAAENSMRRLASNEAIFPLLNQTTRSLTPAQMDLCMQTIEMIVSTGKVFELCCNMDISAARLSYETMSGKRFL